MNIDFQAIRERAKAYSKTALEKTKVAAKVVKEKTDLAAEAVAKKVTEVTGRETTATEVKRAAVVVAGVALLAGVAVASVESAGAIATADSGGGGSDADGWGNDFESQTNRVFAENGHSLNYYTPKVDSAGTINFDPNG